MHAKIFQLDTKPICPDCYIDPDYFTDVFIRGCDYICDAVGNPVDRHIFTEAMVNTLHPIFALEEETLVYQGCNSFMEKWIEAIKEKAIHLNESNFFDETARMARIIEETSALSASKFYIEDWNEGAATPYELIQFCQRKLKPGERLYIGSIIDYHY